MTRPVLRRLAWWALGALVAIAVAGAAYIAVAEPPPPYTRTEVAGLTDRLNHEAAIVSPHFSLGEPTRNAHLEVFKAVEAGQPLTEAQSAEYRQAYQSILRGKQRYLALFDRQLTVVHDHGMAEANNVGGRGIAADHDHHDFSARSNLDSLRGSLARIEDPAVSGVSRILHAVCAYKDLTDIILHMATAPQTKSTPYHEAAELDELERLFARVMRAYKAAQFQPVNSWGYARSLHAALEAYDDLVLHVQGRVDAHLSRGQRVVTGRWLGWQSFGPDLDDATPGPLGRDPHPAEKGS